MKQNRRKIIKRTSNQFLDIKESIFAQLIVIYGIMFGMAIISVIASVPKWENVNRSDIENIIVSAFVPTTITFFSTILFEYGFVKDNKMVSAWFILATVTMSLLYTVFVCFQVNFNTSIVTTISAVAAYVITFLSIVTLIWAVYNLGVRRVRKNPAVSDGQISARKRVKK